MSSRGECENKSRVKKLVGFENESEKEGRSTERCAVVEEVALDREVMRYRRWISW